MRRMSACLADGRKVYGGNIMFDRWGFRLVLAPMAVVLAGMAALFAHERFPMKEFWDIWLPWTGLMLVVVAALFAAFLFARRTSAPLVRSLAAVALFAAALWALSRVAFASGDPLSRVPIGIHGGFCLLYAVLLAWFAFSRYLAGTAGECGNSGMPCS